MKNFLEYHLSEELNNAIELLSLKEPTDVQQEVIPLALQRKDMMVKSKTGSGKTAAFGIPICEMVNWDDNLPQALVIVPTRELALQVKEDIFNIGRLKRMKVVTLFGKSPFEPQRKKLTQKTHIVVGTPGRVLDHLTQETLDVSGIRFLVIDEADELLNMGFIDQMSELIEKLPKNRTTMLFSATMDDEMKRLAGKYMHEPQLVEIAGEEEAHISQQVCYAPEEDKLELLKDLSIMQSPDSCVIFCNTQEKVDKIFRELNQYTIKKIHGGMEQSDRIEVMTKFKRGCFRYLVATDVAARGIDIEDVSLIVNYDVPNTKESYVHRIGRTGRAKKSGAAITFATERQAHKIAEIEEFIGKEIEVITPPEKELVAQMRQKFWDKMKQQPQLKEEKGANL
ncbi:MAG: DEAD/DEAH box helicase, partial [Christensenellaceae bacterium]